MAKRPYSREFDYPGAKKNYPLEGIPFPLWRAATQKAKAEGISLRIAILRLLKGWVES